MNRPVQAHHQRKEDRLMQGICSCSSEIHALAPPLWRRVGGALFVVVMGMPACGDVGSGDASRPTPKSWQLADRIEADSEQEADDQQVAMDAVGNAKVVWEQSDGTHTNVWANRYTPGAGWGAPEPIEASGSEAFNPQAAVGRGGHVMVVWSTMTRAGPSAACGAMHFADPRATRCSRSFGAKPRLRRPSSATHPEAMRGIRPLCLRRQP